MDKFLVKYDFQTLIDEDNLNEVIDNDNRLLNDAIDAAVEEAAGYIRHRYDFDQVFRVVKTFSIAIEYAVNDRIYWTETAYSNAATYSTGDRVSQNDKIYQANQDITTPEDFTPSRWTELADDNSFYTCIEVSTGNLPTNTTYFTAGDNRNPKVKEIVIDITLYNIHSKTSPRNIPDVRRVRYDGFGNKNESENAIRYLEKVQKGQITPDLPVITPTEQNTERWSYGQSSNLEFKY